MADPFLELIDASAPGLVDGLYLCGSLGFGEYFEGQSDVDFTALLTRWPDDGQCDALAAAHRVVTARHPHFDGFHVSPAFRAGPPEKCPDLPCTFDGSFQRAERLDVNPVSWHELARHSIAIRGPALTTAEVWTDDATLRAYSHGNLASYRAGVADALVKRPAEGTGPGRGSHPASQLATGGARTVLPR